MVHPGGFEPPTARFVAEYSIQLSYGCIRENFFTTLTSLALEIISQTMKQQECCYLEEDGASGRIRTSDRSVRSRVLYPAELRMHQGELLYYQQAPQINHCHASQDGASGRMTHCARPTGRCLRSVIFPGTCGYLADHETTEWLLSQRRWCIREDSNLRPLGS